MTTQELLKRVRLYPEFRQVQSNLTPDEVLIAGTEAQAEILRQVEPIEERGTLQLSPGQDVYTIDDEEWLVRVGRVKEFLVYADGKSDKIVKKTEEWVDTKNSLGAVPPVPPTFFYVPKGIDASIVLWGTPNEERDVIVPYILRSTSELALSDSEDEPVDPVLPPNFDRALLLGTVALICENRPTTLLNLSRAMRDLFDREKLSLTVTGGRGEVGRTDEDEDDRLPF